MSTRVAVAAPLLVLICTAICSYLFYSDGGTMSRPEQIAADRYNNLLAVIKQALIKDASSNTDVISRALNFVHDNSEHRSDSEQRRYAFNTPLVMQMLYDVHRGVATEKPGLTCGPRALAMKAILDSIGIYSRLVQVFSSNYDSVRGHRLLELHNPDSDRWEVWDPDYRVVYKTVKDGTRVDIMSLITQSLDSIEPWRDDVHGWEQTGMGEIRANYFQAVLFEHMKGGMKDSLIVVNPLRLDLSKVFEDGARFEAWARRNYGLPRIIILP